METEMKKIEEEKIKQTGSAVYPAALVTRRYALICYLGDYYGVMVCKSGRVFLQLTR